MLAGNCLLNRSFSLTIPYSSLSLCFMQQHILMGETQHKCIEQICKIGLLQKARRVMSFQRNSQEQKLCGWEIKTDRKKKKCFTMSKLHGTRGWWRAGIWMQWTGQMLDCPGYYTGVDVYNMAFSMTQISSSYLLTSPFFSASSSACPLSISSEITIS